MTDKQLAEMEAKAEREYRAEQAARMAQAMKAVNEVSKQHNRTAMTFGVVCEQIQARITRHLAGANAAANRR